MSATGRRTASGTPNEVELNALARRARYANVRMVVRSDEQLCIEAPNRLSALFIVLAVTGFRFAAACGADDDAVGVVERHVRARVGASVLPALGRPDAPGNAALRAPTR